MFDRKTCRKTARSRLKKHYGLYVFLCLIAAVIGSNYTASISLFEYYTASDSAVVENGKTTVDLQLHQILADVMENKTVDTSRFEQQDEAVEQEEKTETNAEKNKPKKIGKHVELGRSKGVFSLVYNQLSSGAFLISAFVAFTKVIGSAQWSAMLWIFLSMALSLTVWVFGVNVYHAVYARIYLEGRLYDNIPVRKMTFFVRVGKWHKAAITMLVKTALHNLWMLTVVGGIIKKFSYFAVPYIVAENPDIPPFRAVTLSRKMMDGHKMECFRVHLAFLGWDILDILTFGLLGLFYLNPYKEATYSEYYAYIRSCAKTADFKDVDKLQDRWLFEKADETLLRSTYSDVLAEPPIDPISERTGLAGFFANNFGLVLYQDEEELKRQEAARKTAKNIEADEIVSGRMYPRRLCPLQEKPYHRKRNSLYSTRRYSLCSVVMLFLTMSVIGWIWEVGLHLIADGELVNRGTMHGPWLPIYGWGSVLMLLVLYRLRKNPAYEFAGAILLCGVVEYCSSWLLEIMHHGQKWWDYSGYFLNIDGRVCAEGLLVFGLGGMAIVYLIAPRLDNLFLSINRKTLLGVCVGLMVLFTADQAYSFKYPNTGKGVSDYADVSTACAKAVWLERKEYL